MEMNKEFILNELTSYPEYDTQKLYDMDEKSILDLFNEHCERYAETVEIGSLYENSESSPFVTETPDGWQMVGDLIKKSPRRILKFKMTNGFTVSVSDDHLFETPKGWIKSGVLNEKDLILTKEGFIEIKSINELEVEEVYDWQIMHENHRYWASGISSHNTGKSFFCLNVVREAQKQGYDVIYCDTEGAIDKSSAKNFGIDLNKIRYQPIQTVSQFQTFVSNILDLVKKSKSDGENPKILLILDSLGMLSTDKELADALKGHNAADMGAKAKELRKLFRVITLDLTAAKIPLICTNHVYTGGGYMPTKESSGGDGPIFAMSAVAFLSKAQLKDGAGTKTGIVVTSNLKKSRFTVPEMIKFHISFANGMNPYVGLQDYVSWDTCGIERGKYEEVKNAEGKKEMVFKPNASSVRWGVKHLGKTIASTELFSPNIFTDEVLRNLDEHVIQPKFKLPDLSDPTEILDELEMGGNEVDDNGEE